MTLSTLNKSLLHLSIIATSLSTTFTVYAAQSHGLSAALQDSKVNIALRYRLESVDEDAKDDDALASTLKSRITVTTGKFENFNAKVEVDNVTYVGNDKFNSTINGKTSYPVVADPDGTEVNQAMLQYHGEFYTASAGRQRINLDDQRFIGGVAWRQNEQTYDGYRLQMKPTDAVTVDTSYIYNVNRIFGEDNDASSDFHGDVILLNAKYALDKDHGFTAYYYAMEFDNAYAASNDTYGITYNGKYDFSGTGVTIKAGYAAQEDAGDNPNSYEADYIVFDANINFDGFSLGGGYEVLGGDNGVGFQTPLATAHKFQGFSDQFLGTPATGVEDAYVKAGTKIGPVKLSAAYHVFKADQGNQDFGDEINLVAAYKVNKQISTLVKAASFSNDDNFKSDTTKLWFMISASY